LHDALLLLLHAPPIRGKSREGKQTKKTLSSKFTAVCESIGVSAARDYAIGNQVNRF